MTISFTGRLAGADEVHNSNDIEINAAQEATPGVLPATATDQYWFGLEINSFSGFGGAVETIRRRYFERRRQLGKARIQKITAEAGWQGDVTDEQFGRFGRGFLFSDDGSSSHDASTLGALGSKADTQSIYAQKTVTVGNITEAIVYLLPILLLHWVAVHLKAVSWC